MRIAAFISIEDGRAKVSRIEYNRGMGEIVPASNWEALEPDAKQEHVRQCSRMASYGLYDVSPELAARAEW